ncbi:MAG: hypothetical protein LBF56_02865 [Holosporales bacterium]|jgi:hypothetical protein|nr:hypothetical protein [Holosporales bacterium]
MIIRRFFVVYGCIIAFWSTLSYASDESSSVKLTPVVNTDFASPGTKERYTLEVPRGKVVPQKLQTFVEFYIMHPSAVDEFLQSFSSGQESGQQNGIVSTEVGMISLEELQESAEALDEIIEIIANPLQLSGLTTLPKLSKMMLLDIANMLTEEGRAELITLRDTLAAEITGENVLTFAVADETINSGFQTGQNYRQYTTPGQQTKLAHLMHCYVVSKGYQIQKLDPPIAMEDLQILIQKVVDYSGYDGHSAGLLELAKRLESLIK